MKKLIVSIVAAMCASAFALGASAAQDRHGKHHGNHHGTPPPHRTWHNGYRHRHHHGHTKTNGHKIHFTRHHKG